MRRIILPECTVKAQDPSKNRLLYHHPCVDETKITPNPQPQISFIYRACYCPHLKRLIYIRTIGLFWRTGSETWRAQIWKKTTKSL